MKICASGRAEARRRENKAARNLYKFLSEVFIYLTLAEIENLIKNKLRKALQENDEEILSTATSELLEQAQSLLRNIERMREVKYE